MTSQDQADRFFAAVDTLRQRDMAVWPRPRRPHHPRKAIPTMKIDAPLVVMWLLAALVASLAIGETLWMIGVLP